MVSALHLEGFLWGDVSGNNVLVDNKATVTLIDTDSLQFQNRITGDIYRNEFTTKGYQSPEWFKDKYVRATPAQDYWGMGVLIFELLNWGVHPFAGRGAEFAPRIDDRVPERLYPYQDHPPHGIQPPLHAKPITNLPNTIVQAFRKCFVEGYDTQLLRPSAQQWLSILQEAEKHLEPGKVCGHYFFDHVATCPTCGKPRKKRQSPPSPPRQQQPTPPTRVRCPKCGHENDPAAPPYCAKCGTPLPPFRKCPHCGATDVPVRATYCHHQHRKGVTNKL